jgi:hypothetical protein
MAKLIGPNHGLDAALVQEKKNHPGVTAWDKRTATLKTLVNNNNEFTNFFNNLPFLSAPASS